MGVYHSKHIVHGEIMPREFRESQLMEIVSRVPGISLFEARKIMGISKSQAHTLVNKMEHEKRIRSEMETSGPVKIKYLFPQN